MFPLPVILVGIDEDQLPEIRRELSHVMADVECEFATADSAFECLRRSRKQTRLFIIPAGSQFDVEGIRRLSDYFSDWPILALSPRTRSLDLLLEANRAGATQVVLSPLDREDFQGALKVVGSQFGQAILDHLVFAVAGAVGGSGATTIAINLASEIAHRFQRSTILAELALQIGALASMLDVHPRMTLPQLLKEFHRLDDLLVEKRLVPIADGFRVLAGAQEFCPMPSIESGHLARIVGYLRRLADVTVFDIPDALHDAGAVLDAADQVLLINNQSIPSIRAMKLFCEQHSEERLNHSLRIVINRFNPQLKGLTAAEIQELLGVSQTATIANDFRAVKLAINHGKPLRGVAPESSILHDLDVLIHSLLGLQRRSAIPGMHRLFGRVLHALNR